MSQINSYLTGTGAAPIEKITGNTGGAVGPSAGGNVNLTGTAPISVAGNPGTNSLVISASSATTIATGVIQLATNAQAIAGADSSNAIVSSSLTAKLGSQTLNGVAYGGSSSGAINWSAVGNNGAVLLGATGAAPAFAGLTSTGGTIAFTTGANSLNLEVAAGGFSWNEIMVVGPTTMAVENGYIANNAGQVSLLLPAVAAQGAGVRIAGKGAGGWKITQGAGQIIHFNSSDTTTGVGGSLASTNRYNVVELLCITANTDWLVLSSSGNLTVV